MKHITSCAALTTLLLIANTIIFSPPIRAANDGTIDPINKYAWSEQGGWVNFHTDYGNVRVFSDKISGYAWVEKFGWINLAPPGSGITNNGNGILDGYAWGEQIGYIHFSGVTIDAHGYFHGYAFATTTGRINFNCDNTNTCSDGNFKVQTTWLPPSTPTLTPPSSNPPTSGSGSGGSLPISNSNISTSNPIFLSSIPPTSTVTKTEKNQTINDEGKLIVKSKSCPYFIKSLKKGDRGSEVKKIQEFLIFYNYLTPTSSLGYFGEGTYKAVKDFQTTNRAKILTPWGQTKPTGWWYITTRKQANTLVDCRPTGKLIITVTPTGFLNVRSTPKNNGMIIGKIYPGNTFVFNDVYEQWYYIDLDENTSGWINKKYVKILK